MTKECLPLRRNLTIGNTVSAGLPVDEALVFQRNRLTTGGDCLGRRRLPVVTGPHGDGQVCLLGVRPQD